MDGTMHRCGGEPEISAVVAEPVSSEAIPHLDGVRALAVAIVFLSHVGLDRLVPGNFGVSLFFVLSGFLITTLMRQEFAATGRLSFSAFYLRRGLRLAPPLVVMLVIAMLLESAGWVPGTTTSGGVLSVLFYFGNYFIAVFGYEPMPPGLSVTWSLAVEEHFYLLYPPLALWLLRRGERRRAAITLGTACAAILAWRCILVFGLGAGDHYIKHASDTRMDAMLFGCLLALVKNPWLDPVAPRRPVREWMMLGACGAGLLLSFVWRSEAFRNTFRYTLQYAALVPFFYFCVARAESAWFRWLSWRPIVWLGAVSYVVYLSNQMVVFTLQQQFPRLPSWAVGVLAAPIVLLIAAAMRQWVERPCAKLRRRLHHASGRNPEMQIVEVPQPAPVS